MSCLANGASFLAGISTAGKIQLAAFCGFEFAVGIFWPSMMKQRSQHVPEEMRATIINFFRIPLNMFVCIVLYNVRPHPQWCLCRVASWLHRSVLPDLHAGVWCYLADQKLGCRPLMRFSPWAALARMQPPRRLAAVDTGAMPLTLHSLQQIGLLSAHPPDGLAHACRCQASP